MNRTVVVCVNFTILYFFVFSFNPIIAQFYPKVPTDMILVKKKMNTIAAADVYSKTEWNYQINQGKVTTIKYKARIIKYDKLGRIMEISNLNQKGENLSIIVFKYDNNNLLQQETEFLPTGEMLGKTKYTYSYNGQLKDITWINSFEFIVNRKSFDIDENSGIVTEWQYYSPDSIITKTEYYYSNLLNGVITKQINYNGAEILNNTIIYERDSVQTIQKENFLDSKGKLNHYNEYQYNTKGLLKQISLVYPNKTSIPGVIYDYDNDGLITGTVEYDNKGNIINFKKFTYE